MERRRESGTGRGSERRVKDTKAELETGARRRQLGWRLRSHLQVGTGMGLALCEEESASDLHQVPAHRVGEGGVVLGSVAVPEEDVGLRRVSTYVKIASCGEVE